MAGTTVQQIIGYEAMLGLVETIKTGVPEDIIPPGFMTPGQTVNGNQGKYIRVEGNRQTARMVQYGSPSQKRNLKGLSEIGVTLIHSFENQTHDVNTLMKLQDYQNPTQQVMGRQEIDRQTVSFFQLFRNLRISAFFSMLTKGAIYFDGSGNLLPTSSGAVTTVDYAVPAVNKNQIDGIIGTTWATAATDILGDVRAIKKKARQTTGYPLRHAFYGADILGYLLTNTKIKELINRNAGYQVVAAAGEIPQGLLGFEWHPIDDAFFVDNDASTQEWAGGDALILTPEPEASWFEWLQGTFPIPTNLGAVTDTGVQQTSNIATAMGFFSYCKLIDDPVTVQQFAGDTMLPVLKVPSAIYICDVVP